MTSTGYSFGALHHSGPPYTAPHQDASSAPPQLYVLQQHTLPACPGIPLTINSERHFEVTLKAYAQGKMGPDDAIIGTRVLKCNAFTVAYLVCLSRFCYMNTDDFFVFLCSFSSLQPHWTRSQMYITRPTVIAALPRVPKASRARPCAAPSTRAPKRKCGWPTPTMSFRCANKKR